MRSAISWLLCLLLPAGPGCSSSKPSVVLYCAQDKEFAEDLLAAFGERTGLKVAAKFDTEANKSVGLYVELVREKQRPRCDVFWNNEILSTLRLQKQGLLAPYASPSAAALPAWARATDHTWHAFAARARVLIVNTGLVPESERPRSLFELTRPRWRGRVVMAKPQFGTSATQAACLFSVLGADKARAYYRGLRNNDVQIAPGNKQVAEWVGRGRAPGRGSKESPPAVGITDTDDAYLEVQAGRPVAIIFPDAGADELGTLFIPNTVALVRGGPNPDGGRGLIDYLLSAEVEARLAKEGAHQFPVNPKVDITLPAPLEAGRKAKRMAVDFDKAAEAWDEAQRFLLAEIVPP